MLPPVERFPPPVEEQFVRARMEALAEINSTSYIIVAILVMAFSAWDWYVDPVNWRTALQYRALGTVVIIVSGLTQRISGRVEWAPLLAKIRYTASVIAVAGALAVLKDGFVVGLAGLVAIMLAAPYIAVHRRDLLVMNVVPLIAIATIMYAAHLDTFTVVNASIFILLSVGVCMLLTRVFEAGNRRAFSLEQALSNEARSDALTGLRNRRSLDEAGNIEVKRAVRASSALSVILLDIDHFKEINDKHGHGVGDQVIRRVADELRGVARETDALGRWGGEEFLVILPDTDEHEAAMLAERMRVAVEAATMPVENLRVTISLGAAGHVISQLADAARWGQVISAADRAMYRAKAAGRNRVVAATSG